LAKERLIRMGIEALATPRCEKLAQARNQGFFVFTSGRHWQAFFRSLNHRSIRRASRDVAPRHQAFWSAEGKHGGDPMMTRIRMMRTL
jgi:hypothetical protein